jgi:hypothetical protein
MHFIKYVNYKLYSGYIKLGDSNFASILSANLISSLVFMLNTLFFCNIYCAGTGNELRTLFKGFHLEIMLFILLFFILLNYLFIYYNKKYINIFDKMYQIDKKNVYSNLIFYVYYFASAILLGISFMWVDYNKNHPLF